MGVTRRQRSGAVNRPQVVSPYIAPVARPCHAEALRRTRSGRNSSHHQLRRNVDASVAAGGIFITTTRWQMGVWAPKEFLADPRDGQLLERVGLTDAWKAELCEHARTLTPVTGIAVTCA